VKSVPAVIPPPKQENEPAASAETNDRFDWSSDADMVQHQAAVAVYWNTEGGLVIRQERDFAHQEDDSIIIISPDAVDQFMDRLTDLYAPTPWDDRKPETDQPTDVSEP
jgi:hypothetical protein